MVKIFDKIRNIIIGWWRFLFNSNNELSKKRLEICRECPHRTTIAGEDLCSLCWCFLIQKSLVEEETCYDGRWNDIKINENENK